MADNKEKQILDKLTLLLQGRTDNLVSSIDQNVSDSDKGTEEVKPIPLPLAPKLKN